MAAQLMAGIDGIKRKIEPAEYGFGPFDVNVFKLPPEEQRDKIQSLPGSLTEALDALEKDHDYLLQGGVFTARSIIKDLDRPRNALRPTHCAGGRIPMNSRCITRC